MLYSKNNIFCCTMAILSASLFSLTVYADKFNTTKTAPNFVQLNLDHTATLQNLKYFHCTVTGGVKPHLSAQTTLPLQTHVTNAKETVNFVNYSANVSGFINEGDEKDGTLTLYVEDVNKYAFAYYYDSRLPNEIPAVQVFVSRFDYVVKCAPGRDNRPVYGEGHYG